MRPAAALAVIIGVSTTSAKVDQLVSKRHQKRFVDEAGLYVHDILIPNSWIHPDLVCPLECNFPPHE
jgi:hypothetical protein